MNQAHLWHFLVAGLGLAVFGTAGHVMRALFNVLPDRLSDRPWMDMAISDGYNLSDRIFGTEYDDAGYYRLDSLRNWRNAVLACLIGGWATMLLVPGLAAAVAAVIDSAFAWLWQLFLHRVDQLGQLDPQAAG